MIVRKCKMVFTPDESLMPSDWTYCCSNCKRRISHKPMPDLAFCPYCGSEVEGWVGEEETDG